MCAPTEPELLLREAMPSKRVGGGGGKGAQIKEIKKDSNCVESFFDIDMKNLNNC